MTINDRILQVVEATGLSKTAFAKCLKVSQQHVSRLCTNGVVTDRTIADICREFGVNEDWLRLGVGEMFRPRTRRDALAAYFGQVQAGQRSRLEELLLDFMAETTVEQWEAAAAFLAPIIDKAAAETKETDT